MSMFKSQHHVEGHLVHEEWTGRLVHRPDPRWVPDTARPRVSRLAVTSLFVGAFALGVWFLGVVPSPYVPAAGITLGLLGLWGLCPSGR